MFAILFGRDGFEIFMRKQAARKADASCKPAQVLNALLRSSPS
jgi:hypothetical protein